MELMSHRVVPDKYLMNQSAGVAYDYQSLPKLVAVHTLTNEMAPSAIKQREASNISLLEQFTSKICPMKTGIGSMPPTENMGSSSFTDSSVVKSSNFGNGFTHSSVCLENGSQSDSHKYNSVSTSSGARGILRTLLQESSLKPTAGDEECQLYIRNTLWGKDARSSFLMENTYNKVQCHNTSEAVTETLPGDNRLRSLRGPKSSGDNLSDTHMSANRNLEVGVVADSQRNLPNSSLANSGSQLFDKIKPLVAASEEEYLQKEPKEIRNSPEKAPTSVSHFCNSPEQCFAGNSQSFNMMDVRPRKRPRKSIPRKIDREWQKACAASHSTDSEETASADEVPSLSPDECITPCESPAKCVPVSSARCQHMSSPKSDEEDSSGTKVLFKRSAGVWSVSPLKSCTEKNKELQQTSNQELTQSQKFTDAMQPLYGSGCSTQGKSVCIFSNHPIAPLVPCDPLMDLHNVEPSCSTALDREARIKELLSRQEKLLEEMRQKKSGN